MMRTIARLSPMWMLSCLTAVAGCSCSSDPALSRPCTSVENCATGEACVGNVCVPRGDGGGMPDGGDVPDGGGQRDSGPRVTVESITIEPPDAELMGRLGERPTQVFTARAHYSDGTSAAAPLAQFALGDLRMGSIMDVGGTFTSNGAVGGETTVTATLAASGGAPLTATATLSVSFSSEIRGTGVDDTDVAQFDDPVGNDPARRVALYYPLDGAVMPQNVYPADIQWGNGATGDLFRVTLSKEHAQITAIVPFDGRNHYRADDDATRDIEEDGYTAWRGLAQTDPSAPATIRVDRWEAATSTVHEGLPVSITFAEAALAGSVYYWDIAAGRIIRIDDGTAARNNFMPTPQQGCVGCHSVSPSGRWMAGRLGGGNNVGGMFDLTTDLTGNPPATRWPVVPTGMQQSARWWFSSWSPDETRLVVTRNETPDTPSFMAVMNPATGAIVPPVEGTLPTLATYPAWSPDGTRIAYVTNHDTWGDWNSQGDIAVLPVVGRDSYGTPTIIHRGADLMTSVPPGDADGYPTWSPDSELLVFSHGGGTRSENLGRPAYSSTSALYAMTPDGSNVVRLTNASGGPAAQVEFQPRFSPFQSGGYYWLSFLSRRDYGNPQVGTRGANRQQIWVAAIRDDAAPGEDPSAVGYWLPGQATTSRNIAAYWAPRPCRTDGDACSVGSECCGGVCSADNTGALVCSPPPPDRCRLENETCSTSADCCGSGSLNCELNVCVPSFG